MGNEQRIRAPGRDRRAPRPFPPRTRPRVSRSQAQSRATRGARAFGPVETLEESREVGLVDAGTVVHNAEHDRRHHRSSPRASRSYPGPRSGLRCRRDSGRRRAACAAAPLRLAPSSPSTLQAPARRRLLLELGGDLAAQTGSTASAPRETTLVPDSSSARKSTSSISSRIWSTSARACSTSAGTSSPGSPASSSNESRRASGVRSSCETAAVKPERKLLVGRKVACLGEVHEAFLASLDPIRDDERAALAVEQVGASVRLLPRTPRGSDAPSGSRPGRRCPGRERRPLRGSPRAAPGLAQRQHPSPAVVTDARSPPRYHSFTHPQHRSHTA